MADSDQHFADESTLQNKPNMARKNKRNRPPQSPAKAGKPRSATTPTDANAPAKHQSGIRETIESIVIAFALAFLFRTFEAEAFVIPTGSMATTLLGRHKDVECDACGFHYTVSASDEVDARTGRRLPRDVISGTCLMCRHTMVGLNQPESGNSSYSYNGDRIIAAKFFAGGIWPERWDVIVFRYPEESQINYIKRLVGLPGEVLRIFRGDIYTGSLDGSAAKIERKGPDKVLATLEMVYDNDYLPDALLEAGYPRRWQPLDLGDMAQSADEDGWQIATEVGDYEIDNDSSEWQWLGYRHIVPPPWMTPAELRETAAADPPSSQLITDASAYNTERTTGTSPEPPPESLGLHWVGDLALECELTAERAEGEVMFRLIEAGQAMNCRFDLASGQVMIDSSALPDFAAAAQTPVSSAGTYHVRFANVDDQLLLWIDDELVEFDKPTTYGPVDQSRPTREDLVPVRIAVRGAAVSVGELRIMRDIYYITARGILSYFQSQMISDFVREDDPQAFAHVTSASLAELMSTPERWGVFDNLEPREFRIEADEYFFLGDNSPRSKDSRLWGLDYAEPGPHHVVEQELLIGKAIFIYWPHILPAPYHFTLSLRGRRIPFPFYPNFRRMGFIR